MSNVTVQEALKAAIRFARINPHVGMYENSNSNHVVYGAELAKTFEAALSEIEKCEPVAEAIRERDRLGFAVVNVIGKLDEIIENTQEVEIDDFLHIAAPVDMWNELQAALEDMPKRADLYTSPQPRDWVGLSDEVKQKLHKEHHLYIPTIELIEYACKQLNTKG